MSDRLRIAGFMSGGGRTLINLHEMIEAGRLDADIGLVVSSRDSAPGNPRLEALGYQVHRGLVSAFGEDGLHDQIDAWLDSAAIDLICLCGYLRWFRIADRYRARVINIHPSLLPAYGGQGMYGNRVHRAVLDSGTSETGCTVHFVDDVYDHGPTILQRRCPVRSEDTVDSLAARVFAEECIAYPEAIQLFAEGRITQNAGEVVIR